MYSLEFCDIFFLQHIKCVKYRNNRKFQTSLVAFPVAATLGQEQTLPSNQHNIDKIADQISDSPVSSWSDVKENYVLS